MIIFLYGPDSYRRHKKLKEITALYRQKHSNLNADFFDLAGGADEELARLKDFLGSQSLFEEYKFASVSGIYEFRNPKELAGLIKNQIHSLKTTLIISEAESPPREFKFLLGDSIQHQTFEDLKGERFRVFLRNEARRRDLKLSPAGENFLADVFAPDTWALVNELDKLSLADWKALLEVSQIKQFSDLGLKEKMYNLTKTLADCRSLKTRIADLERLFLQKEAPRHIFNLLAVLSYGDLTRRLADYDWLIKSGGLDYEEALLDLAIS